MKKTPLHSLHIEAGARMVPFAGYDMPIYYAGIKDEHRCIRENVGAFDVSHMGNFLLSGKKSLEFLNYLTVNEVSTLNAGEIQYSAICNEQGLILDDVLVYCLSENVYQLIVNASNKEKIASWIEKHLTVGVEFTDRSDDLGIIAVQGPNSKKAVEAILDESFEELKYYQGRFSNYKGKEFFVSRTGYTGEDGFELYLPNEVMQEFWLELKNKGVLPTGLGCRDTLRLEAGYSLYGHELDEEHDPISCGLGWICPKGKKEYIGAEAILNVRENGVSKKIVGLKLLEKAIPRQGCELYSGDKKVGVITSGSQSPSLGGFLAMAWLDKEHAKIGVNIEVDIRGRRKKCEVVSRRFYSKG